MKYVYVLKSKKQGMKLYIGFTDDLQKRLTEHNKGKSQYTKQFAPWKLVYYEAYSSRKDTIIRKLQLKKHAKAWGQLRRRIRYSIHES